MGEKGPAVAENSPKIFMRKRTGAKISESKLTFCSGGWTGGGRSSPRRCPSSPSERLEPLTQFLGLKEIIRIFVASIRSLGTNVAKQTAEIGLAHWVGSEGVNPTLAGLTLRGAGEREKNLRS